MAKGINAEFMDPETRPEVDFYQYVNGGWMRTTEIPADRSSWGSFHELSKNTDQKVLEIMGQELATPGPAANKAARLFETGMDLKTINQKELSAISSRLDEIQSLANVQVLPALLGKLTARGMGSLIHFGVHPDLGDSSIYAAYLEPASLGLPEREYYLEEDEKTIQIRAKYQEYIISLLHHEAGYSGERAKETADAILAFEKELATHMMSKEDRRQMDKLYNPHTADELKTLMPQWNWSDFFEAMQLSIPSRSIVTDPGYFDFFQSYIRNVQASLIRDYLTFQLIHQAAPFAHASLEELHFDLYSRTLEGTEQMRPRNERLVRVINQSLGELLGQLFVSRYFPPKAKETAMEMTQDIVTAFGARISRLEWMSESTRQYALEKLSAFRVKIGYPDQWKDFDALQITGAEDGGHYLQNIIAVAQWKYQKDIQRIGCAVDREEWFMAPQVVNAYYNPMFNEIVFPAAILQPPFFDWEADAAVNYGGIGAVIGHEITHGFDDQGSRFDKDGNLNEWWTAEDRQRFEMLTRKLIDQFDGYFPFDDLSLNGTFTLGENIADLGGLSVAYDALQLYYQRHGQPGLIDGFTADQRFFMSWATVWRTKTRPEAMRNQIKTDPHPPGMYRAVAAPSNMDAFYDAFDIIPGTPWYRSKEDRIKIW